MPPGPVPRPSPPLRPGVPAAQAAAERAARESYGRLVALLAMRSRDLAAAEDALAEAFAAALRSWPETGVPDRPEAWLLTAARRSLGHGARAAATRAAALPALAQLFGEALAPEAPEIPDHRLQLLFVCAHPAIAPDLRTPLMLQAVLGLDAARIARAFLVEPAAMGQRLVRAKAKIRAARPGFALPDGAALPDRLAHVLEAVYAAFTTGGEEGAGAGPERAAGRGIERSGGEDLRAEALWLGRLIAGLMPEEAEALGLLALMLHGEARRAAGRAPDGRYVPLSAQDARRWDRALILEAEGLLTRAAGLVGRRGGGLGRYQAEAALASAHAQRHFGRPVPRRVLLQLYDLLATLEPTAGVLVGRAAALMEGEGGDAAAALAQLDALPAGLVAGYQPWWACRAHALAALGRTAEAAEAYARAAALSPDGAVRAFLDQRRAGLD